MAEENIYPVPMAEGLRLFVEEIAEDEAVPPAAKVIVEAAVELEKNGSEATELFQLPLQDLGVVLRDKDGGPLSPERMRQACLSLFGHACRHLIGAFQNRA